MGAQRDNNTPHPAPSSLQTLLNTTAPVKSCSPHLQHLALQVAHTLKFQHNWTDIRIHYNASPSPSNANPSSSPLPRPVLSGLPPARLYTHPDEQIALLQAQKAAGNAGQALAVQPQREWVLPTQLRERWTLRKFGEVFDGLGAVPGPAEGVEVFRRGEVGLGVEVEVEDVDVDVMGRDQVGLEEGERKWRLEVPKRLLLATLDDDSTVAFYIVHDGIVKPRQN